MVWVTEFKALETDAEFLKMISDIERIDQTFKVERINQRSGILLVRVLSESRKKAWGRALWFRDKLKEKGLICPYYAVREVKKG